MSFGKNLALNNSCCWRHRRRVRATSAASSSDVGGEFERRRRRVRATSTASSSHVDGEFERRRRGWIDDVDEDGSTIDDAAVGVRDRRRSAADEDGRRSATAKSSIIVVLVVVRAGTLRSPIATALDCTIPNSDLGSLGLELDLSQPIDETTRTKFREISKRLEEGLFKAAHTKEDYMNMETLEPRLSSLIKGRSGNNHNQRHQQLVNSTSSIATMIPTPGMTHSGNSPMMVASSIDSSMIAASGGNTIPPATVTTGSLLSTGGIQSRSFNRSDEEDHVNMDELNEDVSNLNIDVAINST
ncbi:hypothetical protein EZV62_026661 [Acer yangbiense]|uniref:Uncharacterized protein n=1 Tax=Acer yangbiense TaxID=1000413 RepID=A0A5C7GSC8_9ROSI|nr:hypothetical protein EZV62_026661 [Acer yangbiense]